MNNQRDIVTPLRKACGLGSSHDGTHHWMHERITGVVSMPLILWLVWSVTRMTGWDYQTFTGWLGQPVNAVLMILSILSVLSHAALGLQAVCDDYIHHHGLRLVNVIGMKLFFAAAALACVFSILKIVFSG